MQNKEELYILIHKEFSGEISAEEIQELNDWKNSDDKNLSEYKFLIEKLNSVEIPKPSVNYDLDAEWKKLEERIDGNQLKTGKKSYFRYYSVAASVIVLLGLAILFKGFDAGYKEVNNSNGKNQKVVLPDNSTIVLHKNSSIKYKFSDELREVTLRGKAFFSVSKSNIKFQVNTPNTKVEVLGTKFNVVAEEEFSSVAVKEGKVSFENENDENVILVVNQFSECYAESAPTDPELINVDSLIGWTKTKLIFENKTLKDVIAKLSDEFGVTYKVKDKSLLNKKLSAVYEDEKLEVVHKSISTALNILIVKQGEVYYIKK